MILLIGSKGSMGKRYDAILSHYRVPHINVDIGEKWPLHSEVTGVIIATPTDTHFDIVKSVINTYNCPILLEKPMSMNISECKQLSIFKDRLSIVNNWAFVLDGKFLKSNKHKIMYNYYHTGPHGPLWDCCQLLYLSKSINIYTNSPVWTCTIDDIKISLEDIHRSYIRMINAWINQDRDRLWNAVDGYKMTKKVITHLGKHYESIMGKS